MSDVSVQKIDYNQARLNSRRSHKKIALDNVYSKWRLSDATKTTALERVIGLAVLPIVAAWTFLVVAIALGMSLAGAILQFVGAFFTTNLGGKFPRRNS